MIKRIFISYAWGDKKHQEWVVELSKRLMENTIDVELDKWSLKEGHDIHEFMESMVKANDIFRVLIICDENYMKKADNRDGGVGTETQIITPAIYTDQKQEKFIPIVVEKDDNGQPYLPIYLKSRKYIDFSSEEYFESSYEELLRNVLEAPALPKPKIGNTIPVYITESPTNNYQTSSLVRVLENQILKDPSKVGKYLTDFLESLLVNLQDFEFKPTSTELLTYGDELHSNLLSYKIIRDDFIACLLIVSKIEYTFDIDILIKFFERSINYTDNTSGSEEWKPKYRDNYKIIFHELFIYVIAICIKNKNYNLIGEVLHSRYYLPYNYSGPKYKRYTFLYKWHENLENYQETKYKRIAGFGQYVISNLNNNISKDDIIVADLLCYYIGDIYRVGDFTDGWFATTYIFKDYYSTLDFYDRFTSSRHIEKILYIFDVENKQALERLLSTYRDSKIDAKKDFYRGGHRDSIPFLSDIVDVDKIGINR